MASRPAPFATAVKGANLPSESPGNSRTGHKARALLASGLSQRRCTAPWRWHVPKERNGADAPEAPRQENGREGRIEIPGEDGEWLRAEARETGFSELGILTH